MAQRDRIDLLNLRGPPLMFYYVDPGAAPSALRRSAARCCEAGAGYYWQAIRENEEAAQALGINTFRWKMLAVVICAAMTAVAGVFFAFYYNNLFPEQIFHIGRSIEIILGADHRRHRHAVRARSLGAVGADAARRGHHRGARALGCEIPGVKQVLLRRRRCW